MRGMLTLDSRIGYGILLVCLFHCWWTVCILYSRVDSWYSHIEKTILSVRIHTAVLQGIVFLSNLQSYPIYSNWSTRTWLSIDYFLFSFLLRFSLSAPLHILASHSLPIPSPCLVPIWSPKFVFLLLCRTNTYSLACVLSSPVSVLTFSRGNSFC